MKRHAFYSSILLAGTAMGLAAPAPLAIAQERQIVLEEILVTARRREERLQDVPVSMTVLDQDQLHNANIVNAADIANYTPSLQVNNRFGADNTNFAIRGFSQELRTTSSVGVYFAEVVAPRGANTTQSGDGAGPGDFFDLANVQVLKGPQGTLFGRNTTGGAVLLTPNRPTEEFEGYIEGSAGNFDMRRVQAVVNAPVTSNFKTRFGVDYQERDGYLKNISGTGPSRFADLDYISFRASALWDITDHLENYTIFKYTESKNNGEPYSLIDCNTDAPGVFGSLCQADLDRRIAGGNNGEYDIYNFLPRSKNELEQWQLINTTTWQINDNLTAKNILSYAEFKNESFYALYGTDWRLSDLDPSMTDQHILFQMVGSNNQIATTDQKTWVEEFQLQGTAFGERLTWQAGLYWEYSKPNGTYGSANPSTISCDYSTISSPDVNDWRCNNLIGAFFFGGQSPAQPIPGAGSALHAPGGVTYDNRAAYAQGTWEFSDQWSMTLGLRFTEDETRGETVETVYYFPGDVDGGFFAPDPAATTTEIRRPKTRSSEPTWLLGVEYTPLEDMMFYGKYARGYRQGSVNLASVEAFQTHDPEQVDTFEIGAKTNFHGRFPSSLNVSLFYNDFKDQQIQYGYLRTNGVGSTSIINAGSSTIWGGELDASVALTDNLSFHLGYAYLNTNVDSLDIPVLPDDPTEIGILVFSGTSTAEDEPLSYAPEHKVVLTGNYRLPVPEGLGDMVATVSYIYTDDMQAVSRETSPHAVLPSYELVNASFNWRGIMDSPMDASLFVTNLFDEEYRTNLTGNFTSGLEAGKRGVPRMYGARLRYNF